MTAVLATLNQKGGSGKTTTAVNLSAKLAETHRVLLVDVDPQSNASAHLGVRVTPEQSIHAAIVALPPNARPTPVSELIVEKGRLSILPSHISFSSAEIQLPTYARHFRLANALEPVVDKFDVIVIDGPPTLGLFSVLAIASATHLLIPVASDTFGAEGLMALLDALEQIRLDVRLQVRQSFALLTRYNSRLRAHLSSAELVEQLASKNAFHLLKTRIRENIRLAEAASTRQHIFEYEPTAPGAEDYAALAKELTSALSL